jgi:tetratricopeptide (TPR) repeat protein
VPKRNRKSGVRRAASVLLLGGLVAPGLAADVGQDPVEVLDRAISKAEASLQQGEYPAAASHYREAVFEGWLLMGFLATAEKRLPEAQDAFGKAVAFAGGSGPRLQSLAGAYLRAGGAARAVEILTGLADQDVRDAETRRQLAAALAAVGQPDQAVRRLDEAVATGPDDPELVFLLASEYLWLGKVEAAERLFAEVVKARPIPQTHVLIGRAFRDAREFARARGELQAALRLDPSVRRAHYYLGMVTLAEGGTGPETLEKARVEFEQELKLAPQDPLANDQLGLVLLELGRPADALGFFETAARGEERWLYFSHLGRCRLALERPGDAVLSTRRALELAPAQGAVDEDLERIHYQMGLALRQAGAAQDATTHLAEAGRLRARGQAVAEDTTAAPSDKARVARTPLADASPLSNLAPPQRLELKQRVTGSLARAYFNLGVLQARNPGPDSPAERFARAAAHLETAAELDPDYPQVQSSLGVAYFNARQFEKSMAPLTRALTAQPQDAGLKRMLAIACVNAQAWEKAAALLQDDPGREGDPSLEFAYGLTLLRSDRAAEAERVFAGLVARRGESGELSLLLGQAEAAQGKHDRAVASLQRAVELNPATEEAHAALGVVLMSQGRTAEAVEHLEAAARLAPDNPRIHEQLGQAYRKLGRTAEAEQQLATSRRLLEQGRVQKP